MVSSKLRVVFRPNRDPSVGRMDIPVPMYISGLEPSIFRFKCLSHYPGSYYY